MRSMTSRFGFILCAIQELKDLNTIKIKDLKSSLEAHELMVIDRGAEIEGQQDLKEQVMQKYEGDRNFKKKGKDGFKNANPSWSNNARQENEDKVESSRRGGG